MSVNLLGPNTAADPALLRPRVILCAGEDAAELARCFPHAFPAPPDTTFEYRCYRFWRFAGTTVVWTGIGTGCLEPLLWELLSPGVVEDILLVGTAGRLPGSRVPLGQPCYVTEVYSGGTALDDELAGRPTRPRHPLPPDLPAATTVSTDFYYGFSPRALTGDYPAATAALRRAVEAHLHARDLVEMETAQFYYFCERFDRTESLRYLSIKGAANDVTNPAEQLDHSATALLNCIRSAVALQKAT